MSAPLGLMMVKMDNELSKDSFGAFYHSQPLTPQTSLMIVANHKKI